MCSRHAPDFGADSAIQTDDRAVLGDAANGTHGGSVKPADAAVTYRVPLRSLDSDETFARLIRVYGPRDLANQIAELRRQYPSYDLGTPREVDA